MTAARRCKALGQWRLTEADPWDCAYLDPVEPAYIRFDENGCGEMALIRGTGTAELAEDGSIEVEISIHHGDEILLKAQRW